MSIQLISQDEYGQTAIIGTYEDFESYAVAARKYVSDENLGNALAIEEQKQNWSAYHLEGVTKKGAIDNKLMYAGSRGVVQSFYVLKRGKWELVTSDKVATNLRVFIGTLVRKTDKVTREQITEDFYAEEMRRDAGGTRLVTAAVDSLDSQSLEGKSKVYAKVI